jgi:protein ImuA
MANAALAKANLHALRQAVAAIEEGRRHTGTLEDTSPRDETAGRLALGIETFDARLEGGLPVAGLCEFRTALTMDAGATTGFTLAVSALFQERLRPDRPVLWISEREAGREAGIAHAAGLKSFGLAPDGLITAHPRRLEEALWVAETALQTEAFSVIVLELRGNPAKFGLTESRRLHLKARSAEVPLLLLRQAGEEEASSAQLRFLVEAAPAGLRRIGRHSAPGTIGHPAFRVVVEKSRNPAPFAFVMEWNPDERQFYPARSGSLPDAVHASGAAHPHRSPAAPSGGQDRADQMGRVVAFARAS